MLISTISVHIFRLFYYIGRKVAYLSQNRGGRVAEVCASVGVAFVAVLFVEALVTVPALVGERVVVEVAADAAATKAGTAGIEDDVVVDAVAFLVNTERGAN